MDNLAGTVEVTALFVADERGAGAVEGSGVDIKDVAGNPVILLDAEAGSGTNPTLDLVIQHRADASDTWGAVPAAALYDPATSTADTFDQVTDAANTQVLALRREMLKAEIRAKITIGGTDTPKFVCGVYLIAQPKFSSGW